MWKSNGDAAGTDLVAELNLTSGSFVTGNTDAAGVAFFGCNDQVHGLELCMSDTAEDTGLIDDLGNGSADSWPEDLLYAGDTLFFSSLGETRDDRELWMYIVP